jgi:hypothetical protein
MKYDACELVCSFHCRKKGGCVACAGDAAVMEAGAGHMSNVSGHMSDVSGHMSNVRVT